MARPPKLDARRQYGNDRPLFGWRRGGGGGGVPTVYFSGLCRRERSLSLLFLVRSRSMCTFCLLSLAVDA